MKKKERRDIINNSLLENPNMETQAKDKAYKVDNKDICMDNPWNSAHAADNPCVLRPGTYRNMGGFFHSR